MTPIKKGLDDIWHTKDVLIYNKTDSLDKEMRLKIGRIKETKIYLPIFRQTNDIWTCSFIALARGEK